MIPARMALEEGRTWLVYEVKIDSGPHGCRKIWDFQEVDREKDRQDRNLIIGLVCFD